MIEHDELKEKHKVLLKNISLDIGPGWYPHIDRICSYIESQAASMYQEYPKIAQIKEKFATLRVYLHWLELASTDDDKAVSFRAKVQGFIDSECFAAERTCEDCGKPGELRREGYISILCENCHIIRILKNDGRR